MRYRIERVQSISGSRYEASRRGYVSMDTARWTILYVLWHEFGTFATAPERRGLERRVVTVQALPAQSVRSGRRLLLFKLVGVAFFGRSRCTLTIAGRSRRFRLVLGRDFADTRGAARSIGRIQPRKLL